MAGSAPQRGCGETAKRAKDAKRILDHRRTVPSGGFAFFRGFPAALLRDGRVREDASSPDRAGTRSEATEASVSDTHGVRFRTRANSTGFRSACSSSSRRSCLSRSRSWRQMRWVSMESGTRTTSASTRKNMLQSSMGA
jgi:hypothetical protein